MSDTTSTSTYDNSFLLPYLREIKAANDEGHGFPIEDTELWESDGKEAKDIRKTMYISKMVKKDSAGTVLHLTEKGLAYLAENP